MMLWLIITTIFPIFSLNRLVLSSGGLTCPGFTFAESPAWGPPTSARAYIFLEWDGTLTLGVTVVRNSETFLIYSTGARFFLDFSDS